MSEASDGIILDLKKLKLWGQILLNPDDRQDAKVLFKNLSFIFSSLFVVAKWICSFPKQLRKVKSPAFSSCDTFSGCGGAFVDVREKLLNNLTRSCLPC